MYTKGCTSKVCPVSLGLAVGLTCGLGMLLWSLWLMYFGSLSIMSAYPFPIPGIKEMFLGLALGFVKGFLFGFFVALFYDCIVGCCGKRECCRRDGDPHICNNCTNIDKTSSK